jgi:hypothetical protein
MGVIKKKSVLTHSLSKRYECQKKTKFPSLHNVRQTIMVAKKIKVSDFKQ